MRDTDVESKGDSLQGKRILLGVTGGIAAVDTIRVSRELRRHGAEVTVIMTQSSQQIVTPLAVRWASQGEVITEWDGDLSSLENFDGIPTDESEAIESLGHRPKLFKGIPLNFKVTFPDDIKRAEKSLEILRINKHD